MPTFTSNAPTVNDVKRQLQVSSTLGELGLDVSKIDPALLEDYLDTAIAFVEGEAHTSFDGRQIVEVRDGNGTQQMGLFRWPIGRVRDVTVKLPVLALTRTYTPDEIKVYRFQGRISIFTFKLAAQNASLHLDQQIYGNIFPTLPQCVFVTYTYGFPQYDAAAQVTTFDGGATTEPGDTRDQLDLRHLKKLHSATVYDAAAGYLAHCGGLQVGVLQSVSFDGFSKTLNPQAYATQAQALQARRDELLTKSKRGMLLTAVGGA